MKWIALQIMKMMLRKAKNDQAKTEHTITKGAYDNMIKNYTVTIMYIDSMH